MKIERIELREVRLPLVRPFETSFGRTDEKVFLLVSVSADGITGYGECVADPDPFYLPETNGTVTHVLREFLVPRILRASFESPCEVWPVLSRVRGHNMAKACLEMAVWDLAARHLGRPLYALLGGTGGHIASGVSIGLQADIPALVERVAVEVAAGYRRIKIKIKRGADVELAKAVRAEFPRVPLMVDANSDYTLSDAPHLQALDAFDLMMIEQPLPWNDIGDHAILQKQLRTPICLDESIGGPEDARVALQLRACRIVNVKVGRVGGFLMARQIAEACRAAGVSVWCGGMLESGVGRLANVHLQTLPGFDLPGDTAASRRYFEEDLIDPPVTVDADGRIAVPEGRGLGHEIVWSRVEKATTWREEWR